MVIIESFNNKYLIKLSDKINIFIMDREKIYKSHIVFYIYES